jgi:thioesterase domain-containing protein
LGYLSRLGPKEKLDYIRQMKSRIWQSAEKSQRDIGPSLPNILQIVTESHSQALAEYVPQAYQGRITLFRACERSRRTYPDPDLGWGELAAGGAEVHDVPGNHLTMLEEPHVRILAEQLRACLNKAQANGRGTLL